MSDFDSSKFDDGASYLMSDDSFKQFADGAESLGRPDSESGNFVLMNIFGNSLDFRPMGGRQNPSYRLLERLSARTSILIERREAIPVLS